ncbi:MAG: erythromycin esterase family protein [Planctomycetaceae bacterium]|nr:erythromycin esterase family protein [Planctomycetaceae bacterium]
MRPTDEALRHVSRTLTGEGDLDPLFDRIGDARLVLLGEASHGTSEYYTWRHKITERLIREKGFSFIAVEGDWPDCYAVTRYVRGLDDATSPRDVLKVFERWPTWMWANEEVAALIGTLERINDERPMDERVGFYGLDVYSLWESLHAVLGYVRKEAPAALEKVRDAYRCFEPFDDVDEYARAATWGLGGCESNVVAMLSELKAGRRTDTRSDSDAAFDAEQNAMVVKNAERYYRSMVGGGGESWNVRDRHMTETLDRLLDRHGPAAKAVVWEHNTHIGDARATDMARVGMVNVGQLVRERYAKDDVVLVGFGSHRGTVIAGDGWNAPLRNMPVPQARAGSWEDQMHHAFDGQDHLLIFGGNADPALHVRRGHRAIGVVYHPESESGNYVPTDLAERYDAFLYLDSTTALSPLATDVRTEHRHELPETFPSGM